jgi:hypothetical protein
VANQFAMSPAALLSIFLFVLALPTAASYSSGSDTNVATVEGSKSGSGSSASMIMTASVGSKLTYSLTVTSTNFVNELPFTSTSHSTNDHHAGHAHAHGMSDTITMTSMITIDVMNDEAHHFGQSAAAQHSNLMMNPKQEVGPRSSSVHEVATYSILMVNVSSPRISRRSQPHQAAASQPVSSSDSFLIPSMRLLNVD